MADHIIEVDKAPEAGQTILGKSFSRALGGKGANQAIAASRAGANVLMAGEIGSDENGRSFLEAFKQEGLRPDLIKISEKEPTGCGFITLESSSQNRIVVIPGANLSYTKDDVTALEPIFDEVKVVMTQLEMRMEVVKEVARLCHKHHKPFILNPAPAQPLDPEILQAVTYLTPNETELDALTGCGNQNLENLILGARKLLEAGVENVIVALGSKGSVFVSKTKVLFHRPYMVKAIDSTAAGDSFNGALAFGVDQDYSPEEILDLANAYGGLATEKKGAFPSIPHLAEAQKLILEHPADCFDFGK